MRISQLVNVNPYNPKKISKHHQKNLKYQNKASKLYKETLKIFIIISRKLTLSINNQIELLVFLQDKPQIGNLKELPKTSKSFFILSF